ncbi:MAG TPA: hypothetical protein VFI15_12365 [Candidatus Limnocylindrales bacterium]|nr:hypothetical protein [Candidatus Limnocylindrales bacterium]
MTEEPAGSERGQPADGDPGSPAGSDDPQEDRGPRPMIERIGLGGIALVIALLFGTVAVVTLTNGELFLGVMAATGALMTVWAAATSLRRG